MNRITAFLQRAGLTGLITYYALGGATNGGLITPQVRWISLALLAGLVIYWLAIRWRRGWQWHRTALDVPLLLWALAVGVSTAANVEVWRRIIIGIWFAGVYLGLCYMVLDSIANGGLKRQMVIDSILMAGVFVVGIGYVLVGVWFFSWLGGSRQIQQFAIPRIGSTLENPNILGAFLIILIPLTVSTAITARKHSARIVLSLYALLSLLLLGISDSRGAWLGFGAGVFTGVLLLLGHYQMLSASKLLSWWKSHAALRRIVIALVLVAFLVGAAGVLGYLARSLSTPGRTAELRTYLYDVAIQMFREKPLTGYGLFTFGRGVLRLASTPPYAPHNSAHDAPLNIAAELGIIGLIALVVSVIAAIRAMRRTWYRSVGHTRITLIGLAVALASTAIHHIVDFPTTLPFIAIVTLLTLCMAIAPPEVSVNRGASVRQAFNWRASLAATGWVILLGLAIWQTGIYGQYADAIAYGTTPATFKEAADRLQRVMSADPAMPIPYLYQGYFLGRVSETGDLTVLQPAIDAYRRFCDLEPYYAPAWANLAWLYTTAHQPELALQALRKASADAPLDWAFAFSVGMGEESAGNLDAASRAFRRAITLNPDSILYPEWRLTDLRIKIAAEASALSIPAQTAQLLVAGKPAEAVLVWSKRNPALIAPSTHFVINELLALASGDRPNAVAELARGKNLASNPEHDIWLRLGVARLARFDGDASAVQKELETIHKMIDNYRFLDSNLIGAIAYIQFWSVEPSGYLLPGVYYPVIDPVLSALLEQTS